MSFRLNLSFLMEASDLMYLTNEASLPIALPKTNTKGPIVNQMYALNQLKHLYESGTAYLHGFVTQRCLLLYLQGPIVN